MLANGVKGGSRDGEIQMEKELVEWPTPELSVVTSMESYFNFKCYTDRGISKVKLMGTLSDAEDQNRLTESES